MLNLPVGEKSPDHFDVAVRDLELSVAAFVLAKLTDIRQTSAVEASSGARVLRTEVA
ncbi:MAG TPA: hypothetical protein VLA83_13445 [Candidatus Binatia bacterium]|nr:hypothetical protein [Candidatus Binatia bacterium]